MSRELERAVDRANFELRLRPSPESLARKQAAMRELREAISGELAQHEASKLFAASFLKLQKVDYPLCFPTGEETFRCPGCNRLSRDGLLCKYCDE